MKRLIRPGLPVLGATIGAVLLSLLLISIQPLEGQRVDLLVSGGTVIDGSGAPARIADIAVAGDEIVAVGDLRGVAADDTIDARGLHVTPGFIDLHSHADGSNDDTHGLSDPHLADARNLIAQGITTVVVGQDGWHAWPVGTELTNTAERWRSHGIGPNAIPLIGYSAARREVMGWSQEVPSEEQLGRIVAALGPVAGRNGVHFSHFRSYSESGVVAALEEFLEAARATGVRSVVSHLKVWVESPRNRNLAARLVTMLRDARAEGLPVYADHTPYLNRAFDISLVPQGDQPDRQQYELIPPGAGPPDELLRWGLVLAPRLAHNYTLEFLLAQDPERRRTFAEGLMRSLVRDEILRRGRLREALADEESAADVLAGTGRRIAEQGGADRIRVYGHPDPAIIGATLAEVARTRRIGPARAAVELTLEEARFVPIQLSEDDIAVFVKEPFVAGSSDAWVAEYGASVEQPRSFGAFVRRFERYVVERELIELPEAIRQVTTLPAEILGLEERGRIAPHYAADLVLLDLARIHDRASYEEPHRYPDGVEWVLVNGEAVVARGVSTGGRPGRVLLRGRLPGQGG